MSCQPDLPRDDEVRYVREEMPTREDVSANPPRSLRWISTRPSPQPPQQTKLSASR